MFDGFWFYHFFHNNLKFFQSYLPIAILVHFLNNIVDHVDLIVVPVIIHEACKHVAEFLIGYGPTAVQIDLSEGGLETVIAQNLSDI